MEKDQVSRFPTGRAPEGNQFEAPTARRQGKNCPKQLGNPEQHARDVSSLRDLSPFDLKACRPISRRVIKSRSGAGWTAGGTPLASAKQGGVGPPTRRSNGPSKCTTEPSECPKQARFLARGSARIGQARGLPSVGHGASSASACPRDRGSGEAHGDDPIRSDSRVPGRRHGNDPRARRHLPRACGRAPVRHRERASGSRTAGAVRRWGRSGSWRTGLPATEP